MSSSSPLGYGQMAHTLATPLPPEIKWQIDQQIDRK